MKRIAIVLLLTLGLMQLISSCAAEEKRFLIYTKNGEADLLPYTLPMLLLETGPGTGP